LSASSKLLNTGKATLFWRKKDFADLRKRKRKSNPIDIQNQLLAVGFVLSREVILRKSHGRIILNTSKLIMEPFSALKMIGNAVVGFGKQTGFLVKA